MATETRQEALEKWRETFLSGTTGGGVLSRSDLIRAYNQWCLKKLFGAFEFGGIPEEWDYDYFLTCLFVDGFVAVCDTSIGVIPLSCGVAGINVFNRPTTAMIANPVLGEFERDIFGDNPKTSCALIKLQYDYRGVRSIVDRYSALLAECDNSIAVNLRNSKVSFIAFVSDRQTAVTMQKMYHQMDEGKPAVYVKKDLDISPETIYYNHVKETFIAADIQLLKNQIKDDYLTEVGLNNANVDKRERLIVDEVNANNFEIKANVQHWLDNIKQGLDRANSLFGLDLSVRLRQFDGGKGATDETENLE